MPKKAYLQLVAITLFALTQITGCTYHYVVVTKPIINGGNPPIIEFEGTESIAQFFIYGPYTLEQMSLLDKQHYEIKAKKKVFTVVEKKEIEKIRENGGYNLWQLDPYEYPEVSGLSITYGVVPKGFKQICPTNGKSQEPLIEGKIYAVVGASNGTNFESKYFTIKSGWAIELPPNQLSEK